MSQKRLRILIVDDNPAILRVVTEMLGRESDIGALSDSESIIRIASEKHPDVIILDISLNNKNGFEVARELRAAGCVARIIFLTVHEEFEFIRAAFELGASGYVFKSRLSADLPAALAALETGSIFIPEAPITD